MNEQTRNPPPEFILGSWGQHAAQLRPWHDRGVHHHFVNAPQPKGTTVPQFLDACGALNAKGYCFLDAPPAQYKPHPGFGGVTQIDEPDTWNKYARDPAGKPTLESIEREIALYEAKAATLRTLAPDVPIVGNFTGNMIWADPQRYGPHAQPFSIDDYRRWFDACDWLAFDVYWTNRNRPAELADTYETYIDAIHAIANRPKPVLVYVETCDYDRVKGGPGPTPDQFRAMCLNALCDGAAGLLFFSHVFDNNRFITFDGTPPAIGAEILAISTRIRDLGDYFIWGKHRHEDLKLSELHKGFVGCRKTLPTGRTGTLVLWNRPTPVTVDNENPLIHGPWAPFEARWTFQPLRKTLEELELENAALQTRLTDLTNRRTTERTHLALARDNINAVLGNEE